MDKPDARPLKTKALTGEITSCYQKEGVQEISRGATREDQNRFKTVLVAAFEYRARKGLLDSGTIERGSSDIAGAEAITGLVGLVIAGAVE